MQKTLRPFLLFIFGNLFTGSLLMAQCPTSGFTASGPVCAGQPINFTDISTGSPVSYSYDFCAGDLSVAPTIYSDTTLLPNPIGVTAVTDGTNWYVFEVNDGDGTIWRFDFGTSLNNIPVANNIGNPGALINPGTLRSNLVFHQEAGNWYALLSNQTTALLKFDFGASLTNVPTASYLIFAQLGSSARGMELVMDNGTLFLFIANSNSDVEVFNYGSSINNTPTVTSIAVTGLSGVFDLAIVKECNQWYGIASGFTSSNLAILGFGTALSNTPTITALTITGAGAIDFPQSLVAKNDGLGWKVLVQNNNGSISNVNLGPVLSGVTAGVADYLTLGAFNGAQLFMDIVKDSSVYYLLTCSYTNMHIGVIRFDTPCSASQVVSTVANPLVTFNTGGTYYVSLTTTDASGNADIFVDSVIVNLQPSVNFNVQDICFGDLTLFSDSSSISSGSITGWHWDFGDTDTSNQQNTMHTYASPNSYVVTLIVTGSNGCTASATQSIAITPRPDASFVLPNGCSDLDLQFTDSSTIASGTISNWLWIFGNGDSSNVQSPLYQFPDGGNFNITLQVTSAAGCIDDTVLALNINPSPDAAFITENTCVGQSVSFTDQTSSQSPITSYSWTFGDGGTSPLASPNYIYSSPNPATYTVTFIVQSSNSCSDTVTMPIHVSNPPTANFSYPPMNVCEGNTVSFTDLSTGNGDTISAWEWDFGDGILDSIFNPTHTFGTYDTFHVSLIAYSPSHCPSAPFSQDIIVLQSPTATFSFSEVCLGVPTPFTDQSVDSSGSSIVNRMWWFDGIDSSLQTNPSFLFSAPGVHNVILIVTNGNGCTSSDTVGVAVHDNPHAAFVYQNACTDYATIFTNNSTADTASYIATYEWNFGDPGDTNNTSFLQHPNHIYDSTSVGIHNVWLIVTTDHGCRDSVIQTLDVNFSVIPNFTYSPTCLGDIMSFTNFSQNANLAQNWTWNFGDQQTISIINPAHYYVYAGTYTVTLTVMSVDSCISSASKDVVVSGIPVADFSTTPACIHSPYQLTDNSTVSNGSIAHWDWSIDTLATDTLQNPVYTFDTTGTYSVNLVVHTDIGCVDSVRKNVTVHALPVPNFTYTPQYGNPPLDVAFSNLTDITQSTYSWSFGDNTSGSSLTSPHHVYQDTGRFVIQLIATSDFGCIDSITKGIYVIKPVLDAAVTDVTASLINNQLSIQANIANLGTVDIDSVIMQAQLQDGTVIQEIYHQLLPNGSNGIQSYNFVARFNIPPSSSVAFYCVSVIKPNGNDDDVLSNNEKCSSLTNEFSIMEPFPNPFIDLLEMNVILPYDDYLTVELFNNLGQKINTIFDGTGTTGLNLIHSDFSSLADGVYTLRFSFRDQNVVRKVIKNSLKK